MKVDDFLYKHPTLDVTDVEFLESERPEKKAEFLEMWHKTLAVGELREGQTPIYLKAI